MTLIKKLEQLKTQSENDLKAITSLDELETKETEILGKRQGKLTQLLKRLPELPKKQRVEAGKKANQIKSYLENLFAQKRKVLEKKEQKWIDLTLPGQKPAAGSLHPLTQIIDETIQVFANLGFKVYEGPDVELDLYNFQKLNTPKDHPARDTQDTFYLDETKEVLLRTQTSPGQVRFMEKNKPPIRIIIPGVVYRRDAQNATHLPQFYQIEGLMVDTKTTLSDLKGVLFHWAHQIFGKQTPVRLYPHFFPFTEPSVEMEIKWKGKWLEILGAGMVHPNVLKASGIDPNKYQGWAFGMGPERITMIKYGIDDIRLFYQNDLRFLREF